MWLDEQNDEENQGEDTNSLNSPSIGAGAGIEGTPQIQGSTTAAVGTSSSMTPTSLAPKQQFGTIQDYFKGNKNQGEQLGEQFTSKLEDTRQKSQTDIGQAVQGAEQDITANTIGLDADLLSAATARPTEVAGDESKFSDFSKQWNAAYRGPQSFESTAQYTDAARAAQAAQDKATQASSTGGRQQILQDEFGVYGQGNKGLDEAILQQSSYFPQVGEKAKELSSVQDYLKSKSTEVGTKAQAAKDTTEATKKQTQDAFANSLTGFQTDLQNRVKSAQEVAGTQASAYTKALQSGDAEQISKILDTAGVAGADKAGLIDYLSSINTEYSSRPDLSRAYSFNPASEITTTKVATPEDYQRAQALQKLTGVDYSGALSPAGATDSGNLPDPNTRLDTGALNTTLKKYLANKAAEEVKGSGASPYTTLGDIELPKTANAATAKAITQVFHKPISTAGTYQEGAVVDLVERLGVLKKALSSKQISNDEYMNYAKPLAKMAYERAHGTMGGGSKAANAVKPTYNQLLAQFPELLK